MAVSASAKNASAAKNAIASMESNTERADKPSSCCKAGVLGCVAAVVSTTFPALVCVLSAVRRFCASSAAVVCARVILRVATCTRSLLLCFLPKCCSPLETLAIGITTLGFKGGPKPYAELLQALC